MDNMFWLLNSSMIKFISLIVCTYPYFLSILFLYLSSSSLQNAVSLFSVLVSYFFLYIYILCFLCINNTKTNFNLLFHSSLSLTLIFFPWFFSSCNVMTERNVMCFISGEPDTFILLVVYCISVVLCLVCRFMLARCEYCGWKDDDVIESNVTYNSIIVWLKWIWITYVDDCLNAFIIP